MYHITVICVGKLKERFYIDACEEYQKRLKRDCDLRIVELKEERLPAAPSEGEIEAALRREASEILERVPQNASVIALCVEGAAQSSEGLAQLMERRSVDGAKDIVFLIGSSYGLHPSVKERAGLRLSMSPMTFPHHLARVMLLEQIYRAVQILKGTRYHK